MTGPEVTAAMKAEDVPEEWVERAAQAIHKARCLPDCRVEKLHVQENQARYALAAVILEIQAQALKDAAFEWQMREWVNVPRRANRLGAAQHVCDWLRARAARLTATPEEQTTTNPSKDGDS